MEQRTYRIVYEGGSGEIEEKKSRFIANIRPVHTEEEAVAFIAEMKKQYWDARHNCSAFVIGDNHELTRCSDDGEPSGTAGRPMLDVLLREDIHNVAVVVTRYFGGTLLGTGGLVRAYQGSVQAGLANCRILEKVCGFELRVTTDYNGMGKVQYYMNQEQLAMTDTEYGESVTIVAAIEEAKKQQVEKDLTNLTNGQAELEWVKEITFAQNGRDIIVF